MGWMTLIVITTKIIMQSRWIPKGSWDEELPFDIHNCWQTWLQDLHLSLEYIPHCELLEIHGFADASEFAYGAVILKR